METPTMKLQIAVLAAAAVLVSSGFACADDHLVQAAQSGGLTFDEQLDAFFNKAGRQVPETAPGQGSPFIGEHQCTPATATQAAQDHANVKPRGPEAGDCTAQ